MTFAISSLSSADVQSQLTQDQARLAKPITALNNQAAVDTADISAWGAIKGKVSSLSSALASISNIASLNSHVATSTSSAIATVSAANSAATGTYNLTNVKLAQAQIIYSAVIPAGSKVGASAGSLTFTQNGKPKTVHIGSGSLTASGVAKAINLADGGVEASVVNTQGGARLVLQSSATGSSKAFSVAGTGALARFAYAPSSTAGSFTHTSVAANATLDINGVPVSHSTNTVSSAVTGLTISLAASSTTGTTVKVSNSPAGLTSAFSTVVSTLSAAIAGINSQIKYTPATENAGGSGTTTATAGPLIGNFTATSLQSQLLATVSGAEASGISANSIGLTVSSAGTITFVGSTFDSAYASNPTAVAKLIGSIYTTLNDITTGALGGGNVAGGTIGAQTTALNSDVTSITAQVASITTQNNDALQILVKEYATAEATAQNASITESYLSLITNPSSSSG